MTDDHWTRIRIRIRIQIFFLSFCLVCSVSFFFPFVSPAFTSFLDVPIIITPFLFWFHLFFIVLLLYYTHYSLRNGLTRKLPSCCIHAYIVAQGSRTYALAFTLIPYY